MESLQCPVNPAAPTHLMQCMEVWGGNQCVDSSCAMAGLDAWVFSRAHADAATGGDVYFVSSCATGRVTRLLVADVSGHGSAVHDTAVGLRGLMRRYVNYIDQTKFVREMNARFVELSKAGHFATALVTTYFAPTGRLSLCNAGHPPPLFYRPGDGRWRYLDQLGPSGPAAAADDIEKLEGAPPGGGPDDGPDGGLANLPLGILDLGDYEQFHVGLRPGDLVLCYTDSLPESRDPGGQMLGQAGLLRAVGDEPVGDPATLVPRLLDRIAALHPGNLTTDDVTALLFRPTGAAAAPLRDRLLAPLRVARGVIGSLGRPDAPAPWPQMSVANVAGAVVGPLSRFGQGPGKTGE